MLRALLALSFVVTCYLYVRVVDVTRSRPYVTDDVGDTVTRMGPVDGGRRGRTIRKLENLTGGLQDGYQVDILYGTSLNENIMVKPYRGLQEVPSGRTKADLPKCIITGNKLSINSDDVILEELKRCGEQKDFIYQPELEAWLYNIQVKCAGRFVGYGKQVAILKDVVVDRTKCNSPRDGGERLADVINAGENVKPDEQEEYCRFQPGFFSLACPKTFHHQFKGDKESSLALYMNSLSIFNDAVFVDDYEQSPAVAITRYEYYNIYHTMAELYNCFLATVFLQVKPKETNIILVDSHPRDSLDNVWKRLFHSGRRINELPGRVLYKKLMWTIPGHSSFLLNYSGDAPPYLDEFVEFIINGYAIRRRPFKRDCKKLRVVLIRRENYIKSVLNPTGEIDRKIQNEEELLKVLRRRFPLFTVEGSHLEQLHIKTQLHKMARTDLLIGMHGAGLTHSLFLPKDSGVIELLPMYWKKANGHFEGLARWRGLHYQRWVNDNETNEKQENGVTKVPPEVLIALVEQVVSRMCAKDGL